MPEMRALVADDDPQLLDIMYRRLSRLRLELDRADNGRAAMALIERNDYDLILTDIYMPGATGLALLRRAKERDPHVQVVVVTAGATMDNAVEALNEGAFGYLNKPFDHISVLDNTIKRALEFRRLILDNKRMAETQRRRGDLLEDEVTERVRRQQQRQRELVDLMSALPDGIVLVEEGGRITLRSPVAEKWLAEELSVGNQPIQRFIETAHGATAGENAEVAIGEQVLSLTAVDLPPRNEKMRKVIIIREMEGESADLYPHLQGPIENLRKGLEWLYQHPKLGDLTGLVEYIALQVSEVERLTGISEGQISTTPLQQELQSESGEQRVLPPIVDQRGTKDLSELASVEDQVSGSDPSNVVDQDKAFENLVALLEDDKAEDVGSAAHLKSQSEGV